MEHDNTKLLGLHWFYQPQHKGGLNEAIQDIHLFFHIARSGSERNGVDIRNSFSVTFLLQE